MEEKQGFKVEFRKDGTGYVSAFVGDFPLPKWEEWNKDCKENFSNCRWAKMINDHTKSKMLDLMVEGRFSVAKSEERPKEETLIGGEVIEGG